jgi:hypothetical protein
MKMVILQFTKLLINDDIMKKHKLIFIALSLAFCMTSQTIQAACSLANAIGTWWLFAVTGSPNFQGFARGTVALASNGNINTAASSITLSNNQTFKFRSGRAQLASNCRLTGSFLTTAGITFTIVDGQLNTSKNVVSGVYRRSDGDVGMFNLIK